MAAGDVTQTARGWSLSVLVARTTTNSAPSGASAGVALSAFDQYVLGRIDTGTVSVWSSAGSGTMTATIKLWGYNSAIARWAPLGTSATAANKGLLNGGNAIDETESDRIDHAEPVYQITDFDRIYAEVTAIGGTSTAINVALTVSRTAN